jgi:hypothetical protein
MSSPISALDPPLKSSTYFIYASDLKVGSALILSWNSTLIELVVMLFKSVVFAGGGCRSVWQAGFWHAAAGELGLKKAVIGCVSAGAAMACMVKADRILEGMVVFKENFRKNKRNAYFSRLGTPDPVFPQYEMYRQGVLDVMNEMAMRKIRQSPGIRVLIAKPPHGWNAHLSTLLGIGAYTLEKHLLKPMHPTWSQKIGISTDRGLRRTL